MANKPVGELIQFASSNPVTGVWIDLTDTRMLVKIFVIVMLIAMIASLFSALYFMFTDRGRSERTVKALTWRIGIWVVLLGLLALGTATGVIKPSNSLGPQVSGFAQ